MEALFHTASFPGQPCFERSRYAYSVSRLRLVTRPTCNQSHEALSSKVQRTNDLTDCDLPTILYDSLANCSSRRRTMDLLSDKRLIQLGVISTDKVRITVYKTSRTHISLFPRNTGPGVFFS